MCSAVEREGQFSIGDDDEDEDGIDNDGGADGDDSYLDKDGRGAEVCRSSRLSFGKSGVEDVPRLQANVNDKDKVGLQDAKSQPQEQAQGPDTGPDQPIIVTHNVVKSDTLVSIAKKYGVDVSIATLPPHFTLAPIYYFDPPATILSNTSTSI